MNRKHTKDWQKEDAWPIGWEEWEDLSDAAVGKVLHASLSGGGRPLQWEEFILLIFQYRENNRNNRIMTWLVFGTLVFTAMSAVFVALAAFNVI